jgi:hypothetical protein
MRCGLGKAQQFGFMAEVWVYKFLLSRGYEAKLIANFNADSDILIDGCCHCEVKISRPLRRCVRLGYYRPYWNFDVSRLPRHRDSVVVLVCQDGLGDWYPFVAPSWYFFGRWSVNITSHPTQYKGYLADCLNCWGNVADVLARVSKNSYQLPLLGELSYVN